MPIILANVSTKVGIFMIIQWEYDGFVVTYDYKNATVKLGTYDAAFDVLVSFLNDVKKRGIGPNTSLFN